MSTAAQSEVRASRGFDWGVTQERIDEAVRRIVEAVNPLRVVAFGSWARGESRPDSDLDIAVILDEASNVEQARMLYMTVHGIDMSMDILTPTLEHHLKFSVSPNSVHGDIKRDGIVLYDREQEGSSSATFAA